MSLHRITREYPLHITSPEKGQYSKVEFLMCISSVSNHLFSSPYFPRWLWALSLMCLQLIPHHRHNLAIERQHAFRYPLEFWSSIIHLLVLSFPTRYTTRYKVILIWWTKCQRSDHGPLNTTWQNSSLVLEKAIQYTIETKKNYFQGKGTNLQEMRSLGNCQDQMPVICSGIRNDTKKIHEVFTQFYPVIMF